MFSLRRKNWNEKLSRIICFECRFRNCVLVFCVELDGGTSYKCTIFTYYAMVLKTQAKMLVFYFHSHFFFLICLYEINGCTESYIHNVALLPLVSQPYTSE